MIDYIGIDLSIGSWSQTITHGDKWPTHQFRCIANARDDEELEMVDAPDIRSLLFHLSVIRGEYRDKDHPLERGIGILAFAEEREASAPDLPHIDPFIHGWWWMPEALYDEVWLQVRERTWKECAVELDIAPINFAGPGFGWDVRKWKVIHILRAGVRFEWSVADPKLQATEEPKPRRRRGLFG